MAFQIEAICPLCGVVASGDLNKIEEVFVLGRWKVSD